MALTRNPHCLLDLFSENHVLYEIRNRGHVNPFSIPAPNVTDVDLMGIGMEGISYSERIYKDQPWSMTTWDYLPIDKVRAIFVDSNPEDAESETAGTAGVAIGGAIGMADPVDVICNILNSARSLVVQSRVVLKSLKNSHPAELQQEGALTIAVGGTAKRAYEFNKPCYKEGWQHNCGVAEQSVPNDTALVTVGPAWLRRDAGTFEPRKVHYKGASTVAFVANAAGNIRVDTLVLYETGMNYNNLALLIVKGAEIAAPGPAVVTSDADVEIAVDAVDSGARWVRLADIAISEVGPAAVVINTADITLPTATVFTFNKTALLRTTKMAEDDFLMHSYVVAIWEDGVLKEDTVNVASTAAANLTLSAAVSTMIDVLYRTEPYAFVSPLAGA